MAAKKPLRVATDADTPTPPMSISEASERGSELDQLIALRRVIAKTLDAETTMARDLASLSKRLIEVTQSIEQLKSLESEQARDSEVRDGNISTVWDAEAL